MHSPAGAEDHQVQEHRKDAELLRFLFLA